MDGLVLGRVGHYFVPNSDTGYCQTALVVEVDGDQYVNVVAWTHEGDSDRHLGVPVFAERTEASAASFHLTRDCPWSR